MRNEGSKGTNGLLWRSGGKRKKKKQRFEDEVKFLEVNTPRMEPINDGSYGGNDAMQECIVEVILDLSTMRKGYF